MQDGRLTQAAAALARAAPNPWKEFLAALEAHTNGRKDELLKSPVEELQRNQGRAQHASALFDLLTKAVFDADRAAKLRERRT
jgi:hypothetical protein